MTTTISHPDFVRSDEPMDVFTERARYVLSITLDILADQIRGDLRELTECGATCTETISEFPPITFSQPAEWWSQVAESAVRLSKAMWLDTDWNPRTPAEEACLWVALDSCWVDSILESSAEDTDFQALPLVAEDMYWDEIFGALVGDEDVEMLWDMSMDGAGDPTSAINKALGIGSYRPADWFQPFDRYKNGPVEHGLYG